MLEVRGKLPQDKTNMLSTIDRYLDMSAEDKLEFAVGRRIGMYRFLSDLKNEEKRLRVSRYISDNPHTDWYVFCNAQRAGMI